MSKSSTPTKAKTLYAEALKEEQRAKAMRKKFTDTTFYRLMKQRDERIGRIAEEFENVAGMIEDEDELAAQDKKVLLNQAWGRTLKSMKNALKIQRTNLEKKRKELEQKSSLPSDTPISDRAKDLAPLMSSLSEDALKEKMTNGTPDQIGAVKLLVEAGVVSPTVLKMMDASAKSRFKREFEELEMEGKLLDQMELFLENYGKENYVPPSARAEYVLDGIRRKMNEILSIYDPEG